MTEKTMTENIIKEAPPVEIRPSRIEWYAHGYTVRLDEDGVSLHPGQVPLESAELARLMRIVQYATHAYEQEQPTLAPRTLTREEVRNAGRDWWMHHAYTDAIDAIKSRRGEHPL